MSHALRKGLGVKKRSGTGALDDQPGGVNGSPDPPGLSQGSNVGKKTRFLENTVRVGCELGGKRLPYLEGQETKWGETGMRLGNAHRTRDS